MKRLLIAAGILSATSATAADVPELTVYTYDSFVADWGPGPQVEEAFEAICECDLKLVGIEDGAALLSRIRLEGENSDADVVLGLDTNLIEAAKDTGLFAPHSVSAEYTMPVDWNDDTFVPFDWGYFAFIHNADAAVPSNFRDLAASDTKILIQDPRSSTPGLGLLLWVKAAYGDEAPAIWAELSDNIVTVTKGWSEAYGLFLEGEADMVLSYTTSPAYHLIAEEDASKAAAAFDEGHYMQVEVAAKLAGSDVPDLADAFLAFMVTEPFQQIIPTTNWMYPAVTPAAGLPDGFDTLHTPETSLLLTPSEAAAARDEALAEWLDALSQ
ncbi:thiamine ABC transporter substrate binding subunit [Roseovarius sp. 2305UL8-3]|uniref:thiamine ABC transporter substrate binding subunit n=1 Tax=Roseovarius conchicola TaxID=3121636 RepID=UPI0035290297